ncbi:MAG TPA: sugar ABC transporter permease [Propionicimonas sp.]|jgi:multiple sugar transport system permease protein|uniref:carbohydrate ABC transporter permease n=1 Tax=Propionicimonas sp. TaxID=1955623 RepID=UPI002F40BF51
MSQGVATTLAGNTPPITEKRKKNLLSDGQGSLAALLISPTMLVILFVVGIPILLSLRESVFRKATTVDPVTGMIPEGESFVGLANFTDIFANPQTVTGVWGSMDRLVNSFWNVTFFTIVCVGLETILGVAMALIMARAFRGKGFVRAAILIPWAIPTIASARMWGLIFDSNGVMNVILNQKILWLADNAYSQWAVIIADVWKTAPFIGLLTLAGLQTIPADVYEAARVDGANAWQQFIRITLPMVKPALVVAVLFRTLDTMRMFDLPWGMIGPGKYSVETISMFAYVENNALRYGSAAAYSLLLFAYIVIVAFLFVRLLGADVIGDDESRAVSAQRKKQKELNKAARRSGPLAKTSITSGEAQA